MAADAGTPELNDPATDRAPSNDDVPASTTEDQAADEDAATDDAPAVQADAESDEASADESPVSHVRLAIAVGLAVVSGLAALVGWLGYESYRQHLAQERRQLFVEVARQGALNLTTIDFQHADADVKRVLDSATGSFYDDFSKRQQPFIEIVKKAQATSKGTITEAGLESEAGDEGQVLVAVSVKTSNIGAAEQEPRAWRMRISVQKSGDGAKVSNVAFVP